MIVSHDDLRRILSALAGARSGLAFPGFAGFCGFTSDIVVKGLVVLAVVLLRFTELLRSV